jgi:stage II sporulation protein D
MTVGIIDRQVEIACCLNGDFYSDGFGPVSGKLFAKSTPGMIILYDEEDREIARSAFIKLVSSEDSTFTLFNVTIGISFHWERAEDQTFQGSLILRQREDGTVAAINEINLEDYLQSVISSEMNATAPPEFLKTHAILSRSWFLKALERKKQTKEATSVLIEEIAGKEKEIMRWYEQEDHDLFDVCADDHCQRYQGITKIVSEKVIEAVQETYGQIVAYNDEICDARFSKACGGLTEDFATAWANKRIPYLTSISDAPVVNNLVETEEDAARWILSEPDVHCNTDNTAILENILPDFDRETTTFFRWKIGYAREELEEILREKSGFDFGTLKEIVPLSRGPSGRICRLKIIGSKRSMVVGKELEIRRWLSRSHLYSSAFIVKTECSPDGETGRFVFHGAGWGHGVGLCQIGAAVMATKGYIAEDILKHYFPGTQIRNIY